MALNIRKLSYALGAEVSGANRARPLRDAEFSELHRALLDFCVVLVRGQPLTREQFVAFSRHFGELSTKQGNPQTDYPEISLVANIPKTDGSACSADFAGSDWHSDRSYYVNPYTLSLLHAVEIPQIGGDTQFANMYLAYEMLSPGMKKLVTGLEGVHIQEEKSLDHSSPERLEASRKAKTVAHSIIKVHPETGRKSLYVGDKLMLFAGMTAGESKPLINFLRSHARRPQLLYRHRWHKHDILIWDNRCTNHNAIGDYDRQNQMRMMEKTAVVGPTTGHVYDDATHTRNMSLSML